MNCQALSVLYSVFAAQCSVKRTFEIQGNKSRRLLRVFHSEHQRFRIAINSEVDMLEQARNGGFHATCHDGTEKFLPTQADFLGLRAIERCHLHS